jgi:crotonobetainyl-CoA:carnitine CoA-transferase CaiB-like acyl-CoA transferase
MTGPLDGYRVLELTTTVSGPMAAMMLADQGAEVIKIEPPMIGDSARYLGSRRGGVSAVFTVLNRNKQSVCLDLKDERQKEIFLSLVDTADALIENYRPGKLGALGLGWETLSARNPRLVYAAITGYGPDGPYKNRRVYDPLIQATTGAAALQGGAKPELIQMIIFDKVTALTTAQAVTAALLQRAKTGRGQYLSVPMVDAALQFNWPDVMWCRTLLGDDVEHNGELAEFFQIFDAKDGQVQIILLTEELLELLCVWRGSELHKEPRFATLPARIERAEEFRVAVNAILADVTTDEVCETLDALGVPVARVNSLDNLHEDEQIQHRGSLVETKHPAAGAMRMARPAVEFDGQDVRSGTFPARHSPTLGGDTRSVLEGLGVPTDEIDALEERDRAQAKTLQAAIAAQSQQ